MDDARTWDVVVVGGGAAGLSGALVLARARRTVLVVDAGEPRNAPAHEVHGYLGREGTPPGELLASGRVEVASYGAVLAQGTAVSAQVDGDGVVVRLAEGGSVRARRLLVTTGLTDELPPVAGLAERWGRDVLHCPYCHGWEVRDRALAVLGSSPSAVLQALLWRQWSADVTLFLHTAPALTGEQCEQLAARGIGVVVGEVAALEVQDDQLRGLRLADGRTRPVDAVVVAPRFTARSALLGSLGLDAVAQEAFGHVVGTAVPADASGATAVPGVWVAGNVTDLRAQVVSAAAAGGTAGAAINADLVAEQTRHAVEHSRRTAQAATSGPAHGGAHGAEHWDDHHRTAPAGASRPVSPQLAAETAGLPAGRALDLGAGQGTDALELARRGWQVTAVDLSRVALERGAERAVAAGADIAQRITWQSADLRAWSPGTQPYDLVLAQFLHLPAADLAALLDRVAPAVVAGGTLLVSGHGAADRDVAGLRDGHAEVLLGAGQLAQLLDPQEWEVVSCATRAREEHRSGRSLIAHDEVLRARRRG